MNLSSRKALCIAAAHPIRWVVSRAESRKELGELERCWRGEERWRWSVGGTDRAGEGWQWAGELWWGGRWASAVAREGVGEGEGSREEDEVEWVEEEVEEEERDEEGHEEGDGTRRSAWKSCVVVACVCKRGVCAVLAYCCMRACVYVAYDPCAYTAPRVRGAPCRGDFHEKQCAQPRVAACYSKLVNHPAE